MVRRWGSIQVRKNRDGSDSVRIRYEVQMPDGSTTFRSETLPPTDDAQQALGDAELLLARRRVEMADRTFVANSKETVEQYLKRWLEVTGDNRQDSTNRNYESTINSKIVPILGQTPLANVSPHTVLNWVSKLRDQGFKDSTIRHALSVLATAMADAVRWRLIRRSPCNRESIKVRFAKESEPDIWSMDEVRAFIQTARRHQSGNFYLFLLETGLRNGEARALRWSDIDLETQVARIHATIAYNREGKQIIREGTKSHRERRLLLRRETVTMLRKTQLQQRKRFLEGGIPWSQDALVFDRGNGNFISNSQLAIDLKEICTFAEIRPVTAHKLRHTSATIMLATSVSDRVVQERLGHSSNQMTRRYQHPSIEMQKAALEGLDIVFRESEIDAS
jgi:integrase